MLYHGYTNIKDPYLPDNARVLNEAGYVVMTFDCKGWGRSRSGGISPLRLALYSRRPAQAWRDQVGRSAVGTARCPGGRIGRGPNG